jgi:hypothetical protein
MADEDHQIIKNVVTVNGSGLSMGPIASNIKKPATPPPAESPSANTPSNTGASNYNSDKTRANTPKK